MNTLYKCILITKTIAEWNCVVKIWLGGVDSLFVCLILMSSQTVNTRTAQDEIDKDILVNIARANRFTVFLAGSLFPQAHCRVTPYRHSTRIN